MVRTICITGGHLAPAVAVLEGIRRAYPDWRIVFIGRRYSMEGAAAVSPEEQTVRDLGADFHALSAGRLRTTADMRTVRSLFKIPFGFLAAFILLRRLHPDMIISLGGYLALPVVVAGWLQGIPSVTHEQTSRPGLATRMIALFSRRVFVSYPDQTVYFGGKTVYCGPLFRHFMLHPPKSSQFISEEGEPIVYITGGTTGSESLNRLLLPVIPELLRRYRIIHQTGEVSFPQVRNFRDALDKRIQARYMIFPYIPEKETAWIFHHAAMIIGRSGANTVAEAGISGRPALYVPLPWSRNREQYFNALPFEKAGSAVVLSQSAATLDAVLSGIRSIMDSYPSRMQAAQRMVKTIPTDGVDVLLAETERLLGSL